ncbi:MAG TPA: PAS domain-containing sensor histidine kinase, partial [Bacteroidetes bacterium]|nr:PAS domain-containing sensor histidine kinase [Bacteroidota bacterium]
TINVLDKDLNYRFVEGRELYRVGVTSEQLVGTNYLDRLPQEILGTMRVHLASVFAGTPAIFEVEVQGNVYELNAVPLPDENGNISQILVVEQNVTQHKKAEEDIILALNKERQLNELKSRFVSMASHEFRTPLSTILSSVSLVARYTEPAQTERRNKHIHRIRGAVKNLTGILDDFLSLEKLETGNVRSHSEVVDLKELLRELREEMQEIAKKEQEIRLEYIGESRIGLDAKMLRNILINLISNAIKYTPEGRLIDIEARTQDGIARIAIRDQGIGIPEEDQKHMFERFFRASNVINIQGTGLGLNIVKRYLDLMGGTIYFESRAGAGTTFFVEVPFYTEE